MYELGVYSEYGCSFECIDMWNLDVQGAKCVMPLSALVVVHNFRAFYYELVRWSLIQPPVL